MLTAMGQGQVVEPQRAGRPIPESSIPVSRSRELERILTLPRREPPPEHREIEAMVRRQGGTMRLRPAQAWALHEARECRGLFAPLAVGAGKTLLAVLLPTVLELGPSCILTSAGLVRQGNALTTDYSPHFRVRRDVRWLSYGVLSSPKQFEVLERLEPKVLILDECQAVANPDSARTKRLRRYLANHPDTVVCCMSGTVTRKSIKDYAKLLEACLGERSPLPRDYVATTEWAEAIDVSDRPRPPGALAELITDTQLTDLLGTSDERALTRARLYYRGAFMRQARWDSEESTLVHAAARDCVRRRLVETRGVCASTKNTLDAGLRLEVIPAPESPKIEEALNKVCASWERPDGELLTFGLEIARVERHVRLGGYYRWVWPKTLEPKTIKRWTEARREWRSSLRDFLRTRADVGMDSPFLVERAIERGELEFDTWGPWTVERDAMRSILKAPLPPTEWVWIDKKRAIEAALFAREHDPLVVWTDTTAVGHQIAQTGQLPWMGAGEDAQKAILEERGERSIVASIKAHGVGRNLQCFDRSLVIGCPSSGATWEQLLGRLHRPGQESETVLFQVWNAFLPELESAIRDAEYIQHSTGNEQKLLTCELHGARRRT